MEYLIALLEYLDLFQSKLQCTTSIWESLGPARPTLGYATAFHRFQLFRFRLFLFNACARPIILELFSPQL